MEKAKKRVAEVWDKIFGKEIVIESWDYQRNKDGIKYLVKKHADGHWSCECMSRRFHSGTKDYKGILDTCKHIRWFMDKVEQDESKRTV